MELQLQIKRLMKERGLQTKDLAKLMGKKDQYVSNIINGGKGVSVNTLMEVAKALNVEFWQLTAPEGIGRLPEDNQPKSDLSIKCEKCGNIIKVKEIKVEQ